jgi:hypothetical protein
MRGTTTTKSGTTSTRRTTDRDTELFSPGTGRE